MDTTTPKPTHNSPEPTANTLRGDPVFNVTGRLLRLGVVRGEWYHPVDDPETVLATIKRKSVPMDIFSFLQRPPDSTPRFSYHCETDHVAAIPVSTFENWWNHQVIKKVRKNVRRSEKYGIVVKEVPFSDDLVRGMQRVYDEVPIRGGRPAWHYRDSFAVCRDKHATHLERSDFVGAYFGDELIGFIKLVRAGDTARTMQNLTMIKCRGLSVPNALLAKCVDICARRGIKHLVFGKLAYGKKGDPGLEEFKVSNGFIRLEFPRYYIPLTARGRLALKWGLHHELSDRFPQRWVKSTRQLRSSWYHWRYRREIAAAMAAAEQFERASGIASTAAQSEQRDSS